VRASLLSLPGPDRRGERHNAIIMAMTSLDLVDTFVMFLALVGPQKVLVTFGRVARSLDPRSLRAVAVTTAITAAAIGVALALTAPWVADFFHISAPTLDLAAGLVFVIYAVGQVLGIHFDPLERAAEADAEDEFDPEHLVGIGFRAMLLPFVVSPLAIAADLQESLSAADWAARWEIAGGFALVAAFDAACMLVFASFLGRLNENVLEVVSRLLGVLLIAVGVQIFLNGLSGLGILPSGH
jgi:multiple antibiotic resistance protein